MQIPYTLEKTSPVTPEVLEPETPEQKQRHTLRYRAARGIGGLVLGITTLAGIDTAAGMAMWHDDTPTITSIEESTVLQVSDKQSHNDSRDAMLVFGGFGVSNSRIKQIGVEIKNLLPDSEKVAVVNYADKGINIDKLVNAVEAYTDVNNIDTLDVYGHSMGGMVEMEVAAQLKERDNITIRSIILDCTPANKRNVRGSDRGGTTLLKETNELGLHFGPAARIGMQATRVLMKRPKAIFDSNTFPKAFRQANSGASNGVMQDQARIVNTFNAADYRDIFPVSSTEIVQIRPYDNSDDHTIDDDQAYQDWQTGLARPISRIALRGSGHASIQADPMLYSKALYEIRASLGDAESHNEGPIVQTSQPARNFYVASP